MGNTVYDVCEVEEGAHIYAHSRKDGSEGVVYLLINNSMTETTTVDIPKPAKRYTLAGKDKIRSRIMTLNGKDLVLGEDNSLPEMNPVDQEAGILELAPGTCTFLVM
jgi:hypothetical protein